MDAHEYNENLKREAISNYRDSYNELRYMLEGDTDMLQEHHGWEEGVSITDKMEAIDPGNTFQVRSGFDVNQLYKVDFVDDNSAYVIFDVSSHEHWIIGQRGDVCIHYSENGLVRFEGLGYSHQDSELFEFIENNVVDHDFKNMIYLASDDEMDERLKAELDVDTAAEWMLQNADDTHSEVISFKAFVECLEVTGYNAHAAVAHALETTQFTKDAEWDDVVFGAKDFVKDIEMHIETIEKLKLQSDWDDVVTVFKFDEDKLVAFDADDFEDELKAAFEAPEVEPEPEVKKTRTRKPGM